MRIFFAAMALCAAITSQAAAWELVQGATEQTPVTSGTTVEIKYNRTKWTSTKQQLEWDPEFCVKANQAVTVSGSLNNQAGGWMFCIGGSCQNAETVGQTVNASDSFGAGSVSKLMIHATTLVPNGENATNLPKASVSFSGSGVSYSLILQATNVDKAATGISNIATVTDFVKCTAKAIDYNMAQPTTLSIYNLSGATVVSQDVCGEGTIGLDLPAGVYFYSAGQLSGKFLAE